MGRMDRVEGRARTARDCFADMAEGLWQALEGLGGLAMSGAKGVCHCVAELRGELKGRAKAPEGSGGPGEPEGEGKGA